MVFRMKKIIITLIFILGIRPAFSQGNNLQFGRVYTISETYSSTTNLFESSLYTVPNGKVWKLEKYHHLWNRSESTSEGLKINNKASIPSDNVTTSGSVWLGAGNSLQVTVYYPYSFPSGSYFFSIIEYNLIP